MKKQVLQKIGLHPFTAFGMIVVDMMLFAPDSTGAGWVLSLVVGMALIIPCVILQRFAYKDDWLPALAKGIIVGVITAIPTPLPSILTGVGGVLGLLGMEGSKDARR